MSLRLVTAPLTVRSISQKAWNVYVSHAVIKWFLDGMNAAVLAPTGLNRQDFFIEANGNTVSIRTKDNHPMSQINTGIVKYHFEIGAGRENFNWE